MIGNKIADKITSVSKKKPTKELPNDEKKEEDVEIATKKRYISPEERKQTEELRLIPKSMYKLRCISSKESYQIIYKLG